MKCFTAFVFLFCIWPFVLSRHVKFFRKDYSYIQEFDAFYKIHWDANISTWKNAFLTCDNEGATLFYPKVQDEWVLVKALTDKMIEPPNVTEILVGLHDEFNLGEFITVDGHSTPYPLPADGVILASGDNCITMNIDTGKFSVNSCFKRSLNSSLPFVCKKVEADVLEESCPTVDQGYKLMNTLKKCYKISEKYQTWQEAMKTCFMEGGTLAVIDNTEQAYKIRDIIDSRKTYFVGVRKLVPQGDFYSIRGKKFSDMYQNPYNNGRNQYDNSQELYDNSPITTDENGQYLDENGYRPELKPRVPIECGTVCQHSTNTLYTETHDCDMYLPFICEMEVGV